VLIRGERGEITDTRVRYLQDFQTPLMLDLQRQDTGQNGNLEGHYHRGIIVGETWLYRKSLSLCTSQRRRDRRGDVSRQNGHLCRWRSRLLRPGSSCQDHYLSLLIDQACETQQTIHSTTQSWATTLMAR